MLSSEDYRLAIWTEAAAWAVGHSQLPAAQRLLVLTVEAAMLSGHLEVAGAARSRLLAVNPHHKIGDQATATEAMKSDEFRQFLSSVRRQISFEEVERLVLSRPADDRRLPDSRLPIGPQLVEWLETAGL